ncbi:MAG TPA: hypothetical protein ENN64_00900, partial [bacterium]|nr:hypothetical protein [bacterium]
MIKTAQTPTNIRIVSQAGPQPKPDDQFTTVDENGVIYRPPQEEIVNDGRGSLSSGLVIFIISVIFFIFGLVGAFIYYYMKFLKKQDRDVKSAEGVLFEVRTRRGNETEIGVAEQMFANLAGIGGVGDGLKKYVTVPNCISFEIVGLPGEIRFYVHTPKKLADLVEKQILGSYQDAEVIVSDQYNIFHEESVVSYASLTLTDENYYPVKTAEDFSGDPLSSIVSALSKMKDKEGALVQIVITPASTGWQKEGRKFIEKVEKNNADPEKDRIHVSQEQMQGISKKTSKVGYHTA